MNDRVTVVNLLAVSYTGSTWAALMLGAHPDVFVVGEVDRLRTAGKAICTLHGEDCPLWSRFDPNASENPFRQISRLTGKRVLVINNARRFKRELRDPAIDRRYVMLFRDGRAFVASGRRKHDRRSVIALTKEWIHQTQRRYARILRDRGARAQLMHYEKLVSAPEAAVGEICQSIGVDFRPEMLDHTRAEPHFIGGNVGSLSQLAGAHGLDTLHCQMHDQSIYRMGLGVDQHVIPDSGREMVIDLSKYRNTTPPAAHLDRWAEELSDADLRKFRLLGGWLNHLLGYPPATTRSSLPLRR